MRRLLVAAIVCYSTFAGSISVDAGGGCFGWRYTQTGSSGPDAIEGTNGRDVINGRAGNDAIFGRTGKDRICGRAGNDAIDGEGGYDRIHGGVDVDACDGELQRACEA